MIEYFYFRSSLDSAEQDIEHLEAKLERLVKVCNIMIETGKTFKKASSDFIVGVRDLASYFKTDDLLNNCLSKFAHEMTEMLKYFTILLDQANRSVCQNIQKLIKTDIKKVKDSRKDFEKISDDLDSALNRNSNVPRTKVQECEEAKNILTSKRSGFAHASLDYVFQINVLHSKKRFDVLETVDELREKAKQERREMEERHTLVQKKLVCLLYPCSSNDNCRYQFMLRKTI
ncbi:ACAP [Mytilus edulis]|uniref:ACAP n=1 Tax=Mytilus edulis TaxID=6550 RepID=A0A8S3VJK4_MYTED|nr:ACAP [Mytilus edulis]